MALQGRKNLMMEWLASDTHAFVFSSNMPRLMHLTLTSQRSLLQSFVTFSTDMERLRRFTSSIFAKVTAPTRDGRPRSRTLEAVAEAIDLELCAFQRWCASREEVICLAYNGTSSPDGSMVSLLSLEKELKDSFASTFHVVLNVVAAILAKASRNVGPLKNNDLANLASLPMRVSMSFLTGLLLDSLLDAMQHQSLIGNTHASETLMRIFVCSAKPIWDMTRSWLEHGPPQRFEYSSYASQGMSASDLDPEFFIEDNDLPVLDPDFWNDGLVLRSLSEDSSAQISKSVVPAFLQSAALHILSAGKSVGLLRALGSYESDFQWDRPWFSNWSDFADLAKPSSSLESSTVDAAVLPLLVADHLIPRCRVAQAAATKVLVNDCGLWEHLNCIEDVYFMARGDAMSRFADVIFARVRNP
jgi:gamma-tubulin complex component 5